MDHAAKVRWSWRRDDGASDALLAYTGTTRLLIAGEPALLTLILELLDFGSTNICGSLQDAIQDSRETGMYVASSRESFEFIHLPI
jgi:hypothetical protein